MLGDMERTALQETGTLVIEPRITVAEINDLLSDLGLMLGETAYLVEHQTPYGLGFKLTATEKNLITLEEAAERLGVDPDDLKRGESG